MDKEDSFPTEEEQYEAYKAVLEGMNNKPIVIRTCLLYTSHYYL